MVLRLHSSVMSIWEHSFRSVPCSGFWMRRCRKNRMYWSLPGTCLTARSRQSTIRLRDCWTAMRSVFLTASIMYGATMNIIVMRRPSSNHWPLPESMNCETAAGWFGRGSRRFILRAWIIRLPRESRVSRHRALSGRPVKRCLREQR